MKVEPELMDHPKFKRLRKRIGDRAAEFLLRLWGHCQQNRRWGFWPGADPAYVEAVCGWEGTDGELFAALASPFGEKKGWIEEKTRDGLRGIVVHDWEKENAGLLASVRNGKTGGRRSYGRGATDDAAGNREVNGSGEQVNPQVHNSIPQANERVERGERVCTHARDGSEEGESGEKKAEERGGRGSGERGAAERGDAHIPTVAEVVEEGQLRCVPEAYCRYFWERNEDRNLWLTGHGFLKPWRKDLVSWWQEDRTRPRWAVAAKGAADDGAGLELAAQRKEGERLRAEG